MKKTKTCKVMFRMNNIVMFSRGKDSTAMLIEMVERGYKIDDIVTFDTGWEFPEMDEHQKRVEKYIGRKITTLHPEKSFQHMMFNHKIYTRKEKKLYRVGNGWPGVKRRWCTTIKANTLDKYKRNQRPINSYVGIAADEAHRADSTQYGNKKKEERSFPLIDWDMSEADCLKYCYDRGFDWGGLYEIFRRVSCFCCPLQRIGDLRKLRSEFPELWRKMLDWDEKVEAIGTDRKFKGYKTVHDLDRRFACEDMQLDLFEEVSK